MIQHGSHRITELWRLKGASGDHVVQPPAKAGSLLKAALERIQEGFEYLQRMEYPSASPVPGLWHPQSKEFLSRACTQCPVFQFGPSALCPDAGHCWKESGPFHLTPVLENTDKIPSQPSFSNLNSPGALSLSSHGRHSRPLIIFVALSWTLSHLDVKYHFYFWQENSGIRPDKIMVRGTEASCLSRCEAPYCFVQWECPSRMQMQFYLKSVYKWLLFKMPWNCHLNFSWIGNEDPCLSNRMSLYCNTFCRQGQSCQESQEQSWRVHECLYKEIKVTAPLPGSLQWTMMARAGTSGNHVRYSQRELVASASACCDLTSLSVTQQNNPKDLKSPRE